MLSSISVVWLCWILALGLRGVEAHDNGGGRGVSTADTNANFRDGNGRFVNDNNRDGRLFGHKSGLRKGGLFGKGKDDGQQDDGQQDDGQQDDGQQDDGQQDDGKQDDGKQDDGKQDDNQAATNDPNGDGDDEGTKDAPASSSPVTLSAPAKTTTLPRSTTSIVVASSTPTEIDDQPTGAADAFSTPQSSPATPVRTPDMSPSITATVQSLLPVAAPAPASPLSQASSLTTTRPTVTSSKAVYVSSTPLPLPKSVPADANLSASTQATQAPSMNLAPLPATSIKPLSTGERAGVGIGITLAILIIAGAIAYELYRRRKIKSRESLGSKTDSRDEGSPPRRSVLTSALTSFFRPRHNHEQKGDPEWIIESAEKVSIVRAGSVKSIESQARPISPPPPRPSFSESRPSLSGSSTGVLIVGMAFPEQKPSPSPTPRMDDTALGSNPPTLPSFSV